ncbi:MAG: hypothetical protein Q9214_001943 [Letrouitia sp. 1 TL-2023]
MRTCLTGQRIVYIGDSTIRQVFWATARKLHPAAADELTREVEKHSDIELSRFNISVKFIWDPFLNSTDLHRELAGYPVPVKGNAKHINGTTGLIVIGGGLWHARHLGIKSLNSYKIAVDSAISLITARQDRKLSIHSAFNTIPERSTKDVYMVPVPIPLYDILSPSRAATITPTKINGMNKYLHQKALHNGIKVAWSHSLMTWQSDSAYEESGLHVLTSVARSKADILLNVRCNAIITKAKAYPMDKTCCSAYEQPSWLQSALVLGCLFLFLFFLAIADHAMDSKRSIWLSSDQLPGALAILTLSLAYCYVADRTQLFNKAYKRYSLTEFLILCSITFGVGVLSLRRSNRTHSSKSNTGSGSQVTPFMAREQTDEWKGWMQFIILIYHYTGASKILWIYEIIRIFVGSYIFMTGFGHTVYFYRKGDFSLKRFASVIIRLNLLSCVLPYVMRTEYIFYYFAPLITFWYCIIYLTMRIGCSMNNSTAFLVGKIVLSAVLVSLFSGIPGILENVFLVLKYACRIDWKVSEWRFRVQLDGYAVYVGMLAGIAYIRLSDMLHIDRFPENKQKNLIRRHWSVLRLTSIAFALMTLPIFWVLTRRSPDKRDYNWWVPYISAFPILSYVILRNCHSTLRNFHSSLFAWLGRCSLETFTLQFHIWLAADTKGILSLGIFGRKATHIAGRYQDLVIFTILFFWLSWLVSDATATITHWIVDPRTALRTSETVEMQNLPTVTGNDRLNRFDRRTEIFERKGILWRLPDAILGLFIKSLISRLILILIIMWVMNMVCHIKIHHAALLAKTDSDTQGIRMRQSAGHDLWHLEPRWRINVFIVVNTLIVIGGTKSH